MSRKNLIPSLLDRSCTVSELARAARCTPREMEDDLRHLFRSLRHSEHEPVILPARCRKCSFEFDPETLGRPSKCPECRGTWIHEARVGLRRRPD